MLHTLKEKKQTLFNITLALYISYGYISYNKCYHLPQT